MENLYKVVVSLDTVIYDDFGAVEHNLIVNFIEIINVLLWFSALVVTPMREF